MEEHDKSRDGGFSHLQENAYNQQQKLADCLTTFQLKNLKQQKQKLESEFKVKFYQQLQV